MFVAGKRQYITDFILLFTSGTEQHEIKCDSEEDRVSWMKLLGLLILFPQAHIPEEPLNNPIKDSFRSILSAQATKIEKMPVL